jgi:3-hydroxyacyl-CoA dehydrogenase/enoyl-CoA hydratase/3-hydroxybutyryl-CoA epimerase
MGPFRLVDEIGIDIAAEVGTTLSAALPYLPASDLFHRAAARGLKGKKGGNGFYRYRHGHSTGPNPEIRTILEGKGKRTAGEKELHRMLYLMVNEAARCLEEGVVADPADVDTGLVFGTGFPPFRGGLCRWADQEGLAGIRKKLQQLQSGAGKRFEPCLLIMKREAFYEG